jgi:hypothetical protein
MVERILRPRMQAFRRLCALIHGSNCLPFSKLSELITVSAERGNFADPY